MTTSQYCHLLNAAYWKAHEAGFTGLAQAFAEMLRRERNLP